MRIDPKIRILSFLVVGAFLLSVLSSAQVLAAGASSKQAGFKAAQTKAQRILTDNSRVTNPGIPPAQQFDVAANPPDVYYSVSPGPNGPVYTWFIPAQRYGRPSGQTTVAGGGWRTPAGQGATNSQQSVAPPQTPPATSGGSLPSLCYYLPSWTTTNWWNAPATSGQVAVPVYNQPVRPAVLPAPPGSFGANPTTVCYSGCIPNWSGAGYTTGTYCAPVCY